MAEALKWDRAAAEHGYPRALNNLGYLYGHGRGVRKDFPEAAGLYCEAAGTKLPEAQQNWSGIQANIRGIPEDCNDVVRWLARIAPQGLGNGTASIEAGPETRVGGSTVSGALVPGHR